MSQIDSEIVNVSISRDTRAVQRAAFGTAMFLGINAFFADRTAIFQDLETLVASGIPTSTPEYNAAAAYFGSDVTPTEIVIGRQIPDTVILTPNPVNNSAVYSVFVGADDLEPAEFTFTSDADATATEIATGLVAAMSGISASVVASVSTGTVVLTPVATKLVLAYDWSSNLVASYTTSETIVDAISACQEEYDSWYALATYSHLRQTDANDPSYGNSINAIAADINAKKKIYGYSTGDTNVLASGVNHIAGDLKAATRDRTFGIYDKNAGTGLTIANATTYGEMGWLGRMLPTDPGAATWMFKQVAGISVDPAINASKSSYARGHNLNIYEEFQGQNMIWEGQMADGTYIDIVHGADWLEARMTERLFYLLLNNDKIPYTDAGVSAIEGEVRAQLLEGVAAGYIAPDFTITVPKVSAISSNDKANRILPAVKFVATLQGAIHSVTIQGRVQA